MAKILVIDDEPSIQVFFKFVFEDASHEVELANNGLEALKALQTGIPDFMIVDVSMPEMTGPQFITELGVRAQKEPRLNSIPFVVMTGENFMNAELDKLFSLAPGFVCFFPKMTSPETVLAKAEEVIKSRREKTA